nr:hypothetical protein B0A51_12034 [Rachicladosporium sp. CCFEE 5018]
MRAGFLSGAQVIVKIAGQALQEYETEPPGDDDGRKVAAYIEIVPDATFVVDLDVEMNFPYTEDRLKFELSIDGSVARASIQSLSAAPFSMSMDGVVSTSGGISTVRPFIFTAHKTTDAVARAEMMSTLSEIGEIKVRLQRCTTTVSTNQGDRTNGFKSAGETDIPEKALKGRAVTHHTALGVAKPHNGIWVTSEYPYGVDPIATYIFKYRTHAGLLAEGIIERSPSPVPLEEKEADSLTPEEARELVRRMREREAKAVQVKKQGQRQNKRARSETLAASTPGPEDDDVTIASENSGRKKARVAESMVIDICDSDDEED